MKKIRFLLCAMLVLALLVLALASCDAKIESLGIIRFDHDTQSISWDKVPGAVSYRVTVGDKEKVIRNSTTYALDFLEPGKYTVYVRAIAMDGSESEAKTYEYERKEESGLIYKLINGNTEYQLVGVGSASGNVVMESTYRNKPVTSIAPSALANNDKVESFVIGSNVREIPKKMFYNCKALVSVTIPDNIKVIGENAFQSCRSLTSVKLPDGVTEISEFAFSYCRALESVTLGNKTAKIGDYAFSDCSALKSIALPETVTYVGDYAFSACEAVTELTLGSKIEYIGEYAFYLLKLVKTVTLPAELRTLGISAFEGCAALESLTFPDKLVSVGDRAFALCEKLATVDTNATKMESVGKDILYGTPYVDNSAGDLVYLGNWLIKCKNTSFGDKKDITDMIAKGTVGIADYAFYKCELFTSVTLNDVIYVGKYAFSKCKTLKTVMLGANAKLIDSFAFYDCGELRDVIISNTVIAKIGDFAFYCCTRLASVDLPDTVKEIGSRAFSNTAVTPSSDQVLYVDNWIVGCTNDSIESVIIRDNTVGIAEYSFYPCKSLKSVEIPDSLQIIGKGAFLLCTQISIEAFSASLKRIDDYAFYGCNTGKFGAGYQMILPEGLESIGRSAFYASSVCGAIIPGSCKTIGDYAFYGCQLLGSNVTFNVPATEEGGEATTLEQRYYLFLLNGVEHIGDYAFLGSGIIDLAIPDSVVSIGKRAFFECPNLATVKLGSGLDVIPEYCFYGCEKLKSLAIAEGTVTVGKGAFRNCKALEKLSIASTVETVGEGAFMNCESLTSLVLPEALTSIGASAFRGMKSLTSVVIPSTVTSMGIHAFYGCTALTVYTDVSENPAGWNMWNTSFRPVIYGCTLSEEGFVSGVTVSEGSVVNANAFGGVCAPSRAGFEFKGWALSENGEAQYSDADITPVPAGTTLFAKWEEPTSE